LKPYYRDTDISLYHGDCLELLPTLPENSIDAIVTDPPYELGFMNKAWDLTGIAFNVNLWRECLRVLKPGGHLLSFGGTRTYHRMVCAIEDAGFTIHPMIAWIFGQGFPKATNLSKRLDAETGMKRDAKQWNGWFYGLQALKPAIEPICMAQKPISEKRMTDNIRKWGTGGINIDACRIEYRNESDKDSATPQGRCTAKVGALAGGTQNDRARSEFERPTLKGRWPANVLFDEYAAELLDLQSGISKSTGGKGDRSGLIDNPAIYGKFSGRNKGSSAGGFGDVGGASRFFYVAKASKSERGEFNDHPTVKPLKLIRYIARLVTPPNGIILDPFAGSGTTLLAAKLEGFKAIGIEINEHYCLICLKRLSQQVLVKE